MPTDDYRHGKLLPTPVTPSSTVCFQITIPDAVQYRAALFGVLGTLGEWYTWDHPTDGTACVDCEEAAQLWRDAIANATFSEGCEPVMSCDDVADCIETSEVTQQAIAEAIDTNADIQQALADQIASNNAITNNVYNTTVIGSPMLSSQRNSTVSSTTDCEPNKLFGSITAIVRQLHTNNQDFLDVIQLTDNLQQRVSKVIKAIPLLNEVPIDEALDFVSQMSVEIKENYDAQWTTALEDEYRCALFCLVKERPTCELTFQDMVEYWNNRLGTSLEPINFFGSLVTYFIAGTWSGTTVVDIMMLIQLSAWQQASEWTGISLRSLQTVGALGANDPDPDWTILCDDCNITCVGTWPDPMTFYQGSITNRTGDIYTVAPVTDAIPNYKAIRSSQYGSWVKGAFLLQHIDVVGGPAFQLYIEGPTGTVLYNGTSPAAMNLVLPACVRYFQAIDHTTTPDFTVKLTIVT